MCDVSPPALKTLATRQLQKLSVDFEKKTFLFRVTYLFPMQLNNLCDTANHSCQTLFTICHKNRFENLYGRVTVFEFIIFIVSKCPRNKDVFYKLLLGRLFE